MTKQNSDNYDASSLQIEWAELISNGKQIRLFTLTTFEQGVQRGVVYCYGLPIPSSISIVQPKQIPIGDNRIKMCSH